MTNWNYHYYHSFFYEKTEGKTLMKTTHMKRQYGPIDGWYATNSIPNYGIEFYSYLLFILIISLLLISLCHMCDVDQRYHCTADNDDRFKFNIANFFLLFILVTCTVTMQLIQYAYSKSKILLC